MILEKNQIHEGTQFSTASGADQPPRNSVAPSPEIDNIPRYSPRKNSANLKPEYSVWYPATSSDSPSGRSNGERLVSAVAAMAYMMNATSPQGVKMYQCGKMPVYPLCASTILGIFC